MPKAELVIDEEGRGYPLRVWRRRGSKREAARVRVKCGCCDGFLDIYIFPDETGTRDPSLEMLEINEVMGTVDQWRKILLPLLGVEAPKREA